MDEVVARRGATSAVLGRQGMDVLVVTDPDDICYLSGVGAVGGLMLAALLVTQRGDVVFVGRAVDAAAVAVQTDLTGIRSYRDDEDPDSTLTRAVAELSSSTAVVGVQLQSPTLPVSSYTRLLDGLHPRSVVDATRMVWDQRVIKSPWELDQLRAAAQLNTVALDQLRKKIRRGVSERELAGVLSNAMYRAGSDEMTGFVLGSGPRNGIVHSPVTARRLKTGDHVVVEFSAARNRYHSPLMRTIALDTPDRSTRHLHRAAMAGLRAALDTIRAGVTSAEVDDAANAAIDHHGARRHHLHRTGYSVGIATGAAWPEGNLAALRGNDPTILREDMVFHLPMILFDVGVTGAGLSETVRVTRSGVETLTNYPRGLLAPV